MVCGMAIKHIVIFVFFGLICTGCLTITDENNCITLKGREKEMCYHEAAVGYALRKDSAGEQKAIEMCKKIPVNWWSENQRNRCFFDVAKTLHKKEICDEMETGLIESGFERVRMDYKDYCKENAKPFKADFSMCSSLFILSILPLLVFISRIYNK